MASALSFVNIFLLAFGGIALIVGTFIIYNTFTMIISQRVRELALGLPGLAAWQWVEGRRWLARRPDKASSAPR